VRLFELGQNELAKQGLILVDTKYEFGLIGGKLHLIDEVHTPDSSRFWYSENYQEQFDQGLSPKKLDKEFLRAWLLEQGFSDEATKPTIPANIWKAVKNRYEESY